MTVRRSPASPTPLPVADGAADSDRAGWESQGDTALVIAIGRGQRMAFIEAYKRYGPAALRIAGARCDPVEAAIVVKDVFLDLWREPEGFDPATGSLRSYLMGTTMRRASVRPGQGASPSKTRTALASLASEERLAIELIALGGCTCREAADAVGASMDSMRGNLRDGLIRLHDVMLPAGSESRGGEPADRTKR